MEGESKGTSERERERKRGREGEEQEGRQSDRGLGEISSLADE